MKKQLIGLGVAVLMFSGIGSANATIVHASLELKITEMYGTVAGGLWDIGDTMTVLATYDDAGTEMHTYNNDGSLRTTYLLSSYTGYSFFSDAVFTYDSKVDSFINSMNDSYSTTNSSRVYKDTALDVTWYQRWSSNYKISLTSDDMAGILVGYTSQSNNLESVTFETISVTSPTTPTPEPATMLLFGTGLVGLVGSRIRRKKKQ